MPAPRREATDSSSRSPRAASAAARDGPRLTGQARQTRAQAARGSPPERGALLVQLLARWPRAAHLVGGRSRPPLFGSYRSARSGGRLRERARGTSAPHRRPQACRVPPWPPANRGATRGAPAHRPREAAPGWWPKRGVPLRPRAGSRPAARHPAAAARGCRAREASCGERGSWRGSRPPGGWDPRLDQAHGRWW